MSFEKKYSALAKLWKHFPERLRRYDMTIDLANIGHLSIKAKTTGKIKRRTLRKWRNRDYANTRKGSSCRFGGHKCNWVPATIFNKESIYKRFPSARPTRFEWQCTKCHCTTAWVYEHELTEPMLNAYKEHTKNYDDYDHSLPPWLTAKLNSASPLNSEDSFSVPGDTEDRSHETDCVPDIQDFDADLSNTESSED